MDGSPAAVIDPLRSLKTWRAAPNPLLMGLDPDLREQEQIADALRRHREPLTAAERRAEAVVSGGFVLAVALLVIAAPLGGVWEPLPAAGCLVALVVALRGVSSTSAPASPSRRSSPSSRSSSRCRRRSSRSPCSSR